jgi:hypothetical protein
MTIGTVGFLENVLSAKVVLPLHSVRANACCGNWPVCQMATAVGVQPAHQGLSLSLSPTLCCCLLMVGAHTCMCVQWERVYQCFVGPCVVFILQCTKKKCCTLSKFLSL